MAKEFTPHDLFFSKLMEDKEMARALFCSYFPPEVQQYIDLKTAELEHLNPKFVNDVISGYKVCDVLYKATCKGKNVILLCHGEHLSYALKTISIRTIIYSLLAVLDHYNENDDEFMPPILSIIYYNGEKPYTFSMDPLALFGNVPEELKKYILFNPILIDLNKKNDDEFLKHGSIAPFETLFKHSHDKSDARKLQIFCQTIPKIPGHLRIPALQYMLLCIEKKEREAFVNMISTQIDQETIISIADSFREEGVEKSRMEIAKDLLLDGLEPERVAKSTKLDLETVKKIAATLH